jgi:succinate-semialdehyde dehydrogenase/glutarate-semialdehyde dehydrogenase
VNGLREAQRAFATTSLHERSALLGRLRRAVLRNADRLADVLVDELGKVRTEALTLDVAPAAMTLSWAATAAPAALATAVLPSFLPGLPRTATSTWRPRGVCALWSPWNYPLAIPMGTIAAALAGGNAVLWKPSEHATRSSQVLLEVLREGGLPHDLVELVIGGPEAGRSVVDDGDVDRVTVVGSTRVGRSVAARCGERLIPCVIELGGKAPAIVLPGADVERCARALVFGGLANGGQSCVSVERVYASAVVFDRLFERTRELAAQLRPGVELGRPVLADHARALGLELQRLGAGGAAGPCVDVTGRSTSLLEDESFGAVIPFVRVATVDDAVAAANAHPLQLSAYVFGPAVEARAIAARLRAPMVAVDDVMIHYALPQIPFGGVGASGFGRVHGDEGLRALCVQQVLVENTLPAFALPKREPWWQPYDTNIKPWLRALDKTLALIERVRRRR